MMRARAARRGAADPAADAYASASLSSGRTPWREARWCALDFELTGLDRRVDEIISFGAIPVDGGRIRLRNATSGLIRPARELSEPSIRVHGIRPADLRRAPSLDEALDPMLQALAGRIVVAHTAAVESTFLKRALQRRGLRLRGPVLDTEVLGRLWLWEREGRLRKHVKLAELADALGLPSDRPHVAIGDALTTAQVFLALATHLDASHRETVSTLSRAERRLQSLKVFNVG
jgi:DNA polymerase-3 subunit epsilon